MSLNSDDAPDAASSSGFAPAHLWRRLAAVCYDALLVAALMLVLTIVVIALRGGRAVGPEVFWFQMLLLGCWWAYFTLSWLRGGQTIGMRAWRLKLVGFETEAIDLKRATLRFSLAGLSALALGLGFLWSVVDRERLAWHDRGSQTRLVFLPKR